MRVLVTGATGFLGSHLLDLLSSDFDAIGLSMSSKEPSQNVFPFFTEGLAPDVVVHTHAAVASGGQTLDEATLFSGNVQATRDIVSRFPDARHLYFSTVSVYDFSPDATTEFTQPNPQNSYGLSKLAGEREVAKVQKYCIVRLSSLYGPRMKPHTLIPNYVSQALERRTISVWGDGSRRQNYIHVADVANLVRSIIDADAFDHSVFLGVDGCEHSNADVARMIAEMTQADVEFVNQDKSFSVSYDGSFTRKAVNWRSETSLSQGLSDYIAWKKKQF